jgi:hypothetical protein
VIFLALPQSYYTLLLLSIGVGLYFLIKFISDSSVSGKKLIMYISEEESGETQISLDEFRNELALLNEINYNRFIIKDMPLKFCEISEFKGGRILGRQIIDRSHLKSLLEFNLLGYAYKDMIYLGGLDKRKAFSGRIAYDLSIERGKLRINKKDGMDSFIKKNGIQFLDHIPPSGLNAASRIFVNAGQRGKLEMMKSVPSANNALLLLGLSNNLIEVIDC